MNKKVLAIVAAAAVVVAGGAYLLKDNKVESSYSEGAIEVTHKLGTTVLNEAPKNVVVLDFGALDVLSEMDVNIVGLPKSGPLPEYLEEFSGEQYTNVGSVKEPDLEAINELNPDLIVMARRMSDYYEEFSEIAPTVYVESDGADYINSFNKTATMFGDIFDKEEKATEIIEEVAQKVKEANAEIAKKDINASIIMVNGRNISAYGAKSRFALIHNELGIKAADENIDDSTHGQEVTFEYLVEKNPGYIFVIDRNSITGSKDITAQSIIENELIKQTDAYKNGNIVYLNSVNWYTVSGGYTSTLNMIEEVLSAVKA